MVNKMLLIPSEEILSVSLSRSTSIPSEVSTLVGCHTNLSELIKSFVRSLRLFQCLFKSVIYTHAGI